jgi:hypothetical protein
LAAIGDELYVGGRFSQVGGADADRIAVFDTNQTGSAGWSAFGDGLRAPIYALATIGDKLYAGGAFSESSGRPANHIAVFDTTQTDNTGWSALGDGVSSSVLALAAIGDKLYVGGRFTLIGGVTFDDGEPANRIAVFDTTQTGNAGWSALGDGVNSTVWALAAIGSDLYVGGDFTEAGGAPANHIAVFDTTQTDNTGWSALGDGLDGAVRALTAIGSDLYVGGDFTQAGGESASRMVAFDTTEAGNAGWSALGDGVDGTVRALAAMGDDLYVGGDFTQAGGEGANHIAVFDTAQNDNTGWSALGDGITAIDDGVTSSVWALAAIGDELHVGGEFTQAGGNVNGFFARYDTDPNHPPVAQPDNVGTDEDLPITITLTGSDGDGDALTFAIATGPTDGSLSAISPINDTSVEVTYTPDAGFDGNDSFTFTVNDGTIDSSEALVNVSVGLFADSFEQN